jgi:serine/threonine protein kinase
MRDDIIIITDRLFDQKTDILPDIKRSASPSINKEKSEDHNAILQEKNSLIYGRYQVLKDAPCFGGEADVYVCKDDHTKKKVAVKVYRKSIRPRQDLMQKLMALNHGNIIRLLDFFIWKQRFVEVMEYASGGALSEQMPFEEKYLEDIVIPQVVEALKYLHDNEIIHRDVKPSNLFLHEKKIISQKNDQVRPQVLLGDFGISSVVQKQLSLHYSISGSKTVEFCAPEMFSGHYCFATDYYAFGISLLFLLTGNSPFSYDMPAQRIQSIHASEDILPPRYCSDRFKTLIHGLLHKTRQKRWGYEEIRKWLKGENVPVAPQEYYNQQQGFHYKLDRDLVARNARELAKFMVQRPDLAKKHIRQPQFYESFNLYDQALASRLYDIRERAGNLDEMYVEIIHTLDTEIPFTLMDGCHARTPAELARLIDQNQKTWEAGRQKLYNGCIPAWLRATGHEELAAHWGKAADKFFTNKSRLRNG